MDWKSGEWQSCRTKINDMSAFFFYTRFCVSYNKSSEEAVDKSDGDDHDDNGHRAKSDVCDTSL